MDLSDVLEISFPQIINNLPFTTIAVLDKEDKILWISDNFENYTGFNPQSLKGKFFTELYEHVPAYGTDPFGSLHRVKINADYPFEKIISNFQYRDIVSEGIYVNTNLVDKIEDNKIVHIFFVQGGAEAAFRDFYDELFAYIDDDWNVFDHNFKFYDYCRPLTGNRLLRGTNIRDLLEEKHYQAILSAEKELQELGRKSLDSPETGWKQVFPGSENKTPQLKITGMDSNARWTVKNNNKIQCTENNDLPSFGLLDIRFDQKQNDIRICMQTDADSFNVVLCGKKKFFITPDEDGYIIKNQNGETSIKRSGNPVAFARHGLKGRNLCVEKTGIGLRVTLDDRELITYIDKIPLSPYKPLNYIGFAANSHAAITDLKVYTRANPVPPEKISQVKMLVQLKNHADEVFECSIIPGYRWMAKGLRAVNILRLRNITTLHQMEIKAEQYEKESMRLRSELEASAGIFHGMVGRSVVVQSIIQKIKSVAPTDLTTLITGETGTGKDLVAGAIHAESRRRKKPYVKIDCASLPETIIESELFGHEKGAFTGADQYKGGKFEQAEGGTIFLDEIGNLSLKVQTKLLRFLQEKTFERLGSNVTKKVNARLIAATNADLDAMVKKGSFRADLLFRLKEVEINLPPLRERKEDIYIIADHVIRGVCHENNITVPIIENDVIPFLIQYSWPGNIRELLNVLKQIILLAPTEPISINSFPPYLKKTSSESLPQPDIHEMEPTSAQSQNLVSYRTRETFVSAMERFGNDTDNLARHFNVSNATIAKYRIIHGLTKSRSRDFTEEIEKHFKNQRFRVQDVYVKLKISFATARKAIQVLLDRKKLTSEKAGTSIWYDWT
jgi:transcriptional regulator with GAF, ATPase, and Fis domain